MYPTAARDKQTLLSVEVAATQQLYARSVDAPATALYVGEADVDSAFNKLDVNYTGLLERCVGVLLLLPFFILMLIFLLNPRDLYACWYREVLFRRKGMLVDV